MTAIWCAWTLSRIGQPFSITFDRKGENKDGYSFFASRPIIWRVMQAMVIYPAAGVGMFLAVMVAVGQHPVEGTLESIYHYAETNIRPATPGHVLVVDCLPHGETPGLTKPPVLCDSTSPREVQVSEAIASMLGTLQNLYWVLVAISFASLLMAMPDRHKLLGLPIRAAS